MRRYALFAVMGLGTRLLTGTAAARVLRVGSYHGVRGQFSSIQAAVNAAKPGDWILIGPGDYKTTSWHTAKGGERFPADILITKAHLHIRGMDRNTVIVDGTKPGSAVCSTKKSAQNRGPKRGKGLYGVNGIMIWKADDVSVQNLTVCNILGGTGGDGVTGNDVWWNGGADSGKIGGWGFTGSYLTATSTYYTPALKGIINSYRS